MTSSEAEPAPATAASASPAAADASGSSAGASGAAATPAAGGPHGVVDYEALYEQIKDKPCHVVQINQRKDGFNGGTFRTRASLIERELEPIYKAETLAEVHEEMEAAGKRLRQLGVFTGVSMLAHEEPLVSSSSSGVGKRGRWGQRERDCRMLNRAVRHVHVREGRVQVQERVSNMRRVTYPMSGVPVGMAGIAGPHANAHKQWWHDPPPQSCATLRPVTPALPCSPTLHILYHAPVCRSLPPPPGRPHRLHGGAGGGGVQLVQAACRHLRAGACGCERERECVCVCGVCLMCGCVVLLWTLT